MKHRKYVIPQIILCFLASVVVLFALQFSFSLWGSHLLMNEITDSAATNVDYLSQAVEDKIRFVHSQLEYLLVTKNVPELLRTVTMQPSDYYLNIKDIQELLEMVRRGNNDLSSIILYYPSLGVYISNSPNLNNSNGPGGYGRVNNEWLSSRIQRSLSSSSFVVEEQDLILITCSQQPNIRTLYYIEAELEMQNLYELLASYQSFQATETLIYSHQSGQSFGAAMPEEIIDQLQTESDEVYTFSVADKLAVCAYSKELQFSFIQLIPYEAWSKTTHMFSQFSLIFGLVVVTVFVLYYGIVKRRISRPMATITQAFEQLARGNFGTMIDLQNMKQDEYHIMAAHFNDMSSQLKELIENRYQMMLHLRSAQLKQMQMQISPHFLYNTFHQFRHMLIHSDEESRENAIIMAENLATFFQYITSAEGTVSLSAEYEHALAYLRIQQLRFGDFMEVDLQEMLPDWQQAVVPRMILQPLFENAFKYGLHTHHGDLFQLSLTFKENNGFLQIYVIDNGHAISDEQIQQMNARFREKGFVDTEHALMNIHQRLRMFYKDEICGLEVSTTNHGGFVVAMTIRRERGQHDVSVQDSYR